MNFRIDKNRVSNFINKNWFYCCILHFIVCILISATYFTNEPFYAYSSLIDMNPNITENFLHVLSFAASKLLALYLLICFWKWVGKCIVCFTKKEGLLFGIILAMLFSFSLIYFPGYYGGELDNYITYQYAIRNMPYFWHGAIVSVYYAAVFTIIPHAIGLPIVQSLLFTGIIFYGKHVLKNNNWKYGGLLFGLFVLPESISVLFNPYRNCVYTVLSLWTIIYFFDWIEKREKLSWTVIIAYALIASVRTEGLLVGIALFIVLCFFSNGRLKQKIVCFLSFMCVIVLLSQFQSLGAKKYYGKDYLVISTINPLSFIFNQDNSNLDYIGAKEDIDVINMTVPVEWIRQNGVLGYIAYNRSQGRDVDQTCMSAEQQNRYLAAFVRILIHNIPNYIKCQINAALTAIETSYPFHIQRYRGDEIILPEGIYDEVGVWWNVGYNELLFKSNRMDFSSTIFYRMIESCDTVFRNLWSMSQLSVPLHLFALLCTLCFTPVFLVRYRKEKLVNDLFFVFLSVMLIAQTGIIIATMPEGKQAYFYPVYYQMLVYNLFAINNYHFPRNREISAVEK